MERQIKVEGMSCHHCVNAVIKELQNIGATKFDVEIGQVNIDPELNNLSMAEIVKAIQIAGYEVINEKLI